MRATPDPPPAGADLAWYVDDLKRRGMRHVHVLAWRDLDDIDAGGSEVHADELMSRWAEHGLDVLHRTSAAVGLPATRHAQRVHGGRRGSRYSVFPRTIVAELTRRMGLRRAGRDLERGAVVLAGVVPRPHITVLHHVHGPMWDQILPGRSPPSGGCSRRGSRRPSTGAA